MPLMSAELYDALLEAGASERSARQAAEAVAGYDTRFASVDTRLVELTGRVSLLQWMVGLNLTLTLFGFGTLFGLLWKLLPR